MSKCGQDLKGMRGGGGMTAFGLDLSEHNILFTVVASISFPDFTWRCKQSNMFIFSSSSLKNQTQFHTKKA